MDSTGLSVSLFLGTHMYGSIPATAAKLQHVLQEGKVYTITNFLCKPSRPTYRPVESPFMVQFTRFTDVREMPGLEDDYPFCTYSLTAFQDIPYSGGRPERFIDVIGKIKSVSDVVVVQSVHQTTGSNTRTILLEDATGNEMRLVLWGDRAVEFDADTVREVGAQEPVIGIFVGTLPKTAFGVKSLSGSAACRWYLGEDIPDIESFRESLGATFAPLASYDSTGPGALVAKVHEAPIDKTVEELNNLNPFVNEDKRFFCTFTVSGLDPDQNWWFSSCKRCRKSAKLDSYQFKCSGEFCDSVDADLAYCVSVFATDGIGEAEFVMFDRVATAAVGKHLMTILAQKYRGYSTAFELANAARYDTWIPPQVSGLVGKKYKLMVSISKKWKNQKNDDEKLSFQVNRIEETFKPELPPSVFGSESAYGTAATSSLGAGSSSQVAPLGPLAWSPPPTPHGYGSPAKQAPAVPRLSPVTPRRFSAAPKRGAKRSLFNTPAKTKQACVAAAGEARDENTDVGAVLQDAEVGAEVGAEDVGVSTLSEKAKATADAKDKDPKVSQKDKGAEDKEENPKIKKGRKGK